MTAELLTGERCWSELGKAARGAKRKSYVAVPYLGAGASKFCPLAKGSILIVNCGVGKKGNGITDPGELKKYLNRGVLIFNCPNLHSKVFVFGKTAFVGSANMSNNSQILLEEAVIRTTDQKLVSQVREYIKEFKKDDGVQRITKNDLEKMEKPKWPKEVGHFGGIETNASWWIIEYSYRTWTPREQKLIEAEKDSARKKAARFGRGKIDPCFGKGVSKLKPGDYVLELFREKEGARLRWLWQVVHVKQKENCYAEFYSRRGTEVNLTMEELLPDREIALTDKLVEVHLTNSEKRGIIKLLGLRLR